MEDVHIEGFHGRNRVKDLDHGWAWVALLAGFISMAFTGGCLTAVGIIHLYLLQAFEESDAKTAWVGAMFSGLQMLAGPIAGAISSNWSCRTSIFIGGFLGPGALAIGSQTSSLGMTFLTIGILAEPPLYVPISVDLVGLGNLNMALGLEMFGIGVGFIVGPPLAAWVRQISNDYKYSVYLADGKKASHPQDYEKASETRL
ncbi:monocarboxylate transporter 9-like [Liolophura sinensis]|uniref:monocarboxylate transporter 9-like n=1 Tax=Liolophura sinensis TaxID=3198878 RepID=UPI003158662A